MKKALPLLAVFFVFSCHAKNDTGLVTLESNDSVEKTHQRLLDILNKKGMTVFATVDHTDNAKKVGITLPPTRTVIFGNPKIGSKLMLCAPSMAIDLPQKMLIQQDTKGEVSISYNAPAYLQTRHSMHGCKKALKKVSGALAAFSKFAALGP